MMSGPNRSLILVVTVQVAIVAAMFALALAFGTRR